MARCFAAVGRCSDPRARLCAFVAFSASVLWSVSAHAQLPATQLSSIFPPGGKAGTSIDVQIAGADQVDLTQFVFSHPGITAARKTAKPNEFLDEQPLPGQFTVTIAEDVPPGIYDARVVGRYGVSNPRAFSVGIHDETAVRGGNASPATAFALSIDQTINGWVDGNSRDYFKVPLQPGQRVLLDCAAQRIDSRMDATLVVYDPTGREILRSRDYAGTDPFLVLTADMPGEYMIELYDFLYRGGNDSFYRLTVHDGPHVDFIFPPAGTPGSENQYTVYGRNLPGGQPTGLQLHGGPLEMLKTDIPLPANEDVPAFHTVGRVEPQTATQELFPYRFDTAAAVPIYLAREPVVVEQEPNEESAATQTVSAPCEIAGQFFPAGDIDQFQFAAQKGEVYYIDLISHRLGLDVDPYLIVQRITKNEQGEESVADITTIDDPGDRNGRIGSSFDTSTDDPTYRLTVDQDATYRLVVRDHYGGSINDPRHVYRLVIRKPQPDFEVVAVAERIQAPANAAAVAAGTTSVRAGGTTLYDVRIERRDGFDGEVAVTAEGLPPGVTCATSHIGSRAETTVLVFQAAEDAAGWSGPIRVLAKGIIGEQEVVRYARGGVAVWETGNRQLQPPDFRVSRDIAFSVINQDPEQALVEVTEDKVWETSLGGKLEIPLRVTRRNDFKGDLTLAPNNVPNELKPQNVTVKGDATEAKVELAITNKNAKPGIYTFYLRADTKIKHVRDPNAITRAEEEQKKLEAIVADLTTKQKQAADAKDSAIKALEEANQSLKQATDAQTAAIQAVQQADASARQAADKLAEAKAAASKDTSDQALTNAVAEAERSQAEAEAKRVEAGEKHKAAAQALAAAQAKSKQAEDTKAAAERAASEAEAIAKRAQDAKAAADKKLEETKKANAPADRNVAFLSTPIRLRVVQTPLKLTTAEAPKSLKPGEKMELPVSIERLYGFAEQVEVSLELPKDLKGLSAPNITVAKDQPNGNLELTAAQDAAPGELTATLRARGKFNGVDIEASAPLLITVEEVKDSP